MSRWRRYARLYLKLITLQLRAAVEYRADFWIAIVGAALTQAASIVFLVAFFAQVPTLAGWTVWNIAILYGLVVLPLGLVELLCDGPWQLRAQVNQGTFDRLLVRPLPPALQVGSSMASIHGVGNVIIGLGALIIGLVRSSIDWHWWTVPVLLLAVASALVLTSAINYLTNMIAFWEPNAQRSFPTMINVSRDFARFPLDIHHRVVQVIVSVVIPYAFISYFPALLVLQRGGAARWLGLATPLMAALFVVLARFVWRRGLVRYQGVGH